MTEAVTVTETATATGTGSSEIGSLLLFVLISAMFVYDKLTDSSDPSKAEAARQAFANDEISHAELVRRLEVTECPETEKIRNAVEPVPGIGEEISFAIAERFDALAALRRASVDDLTAIPGVGESKAQGIVERLEERDRDG